MSTFNEEFEHWVTQAREWKASGETRRASSYEIAPLVDRIDEQAATITALRTEVEALRVAGEVMMEVLENVPYPSEDVFAALQRWLQQPAVRAAIT